MGALILAASVGTVISLLIALSAAWLLVGSRWRKWLHALEEALGQDPRRGVVELLYGLTNWSPRELALVAQRTATGLPGITSMESPLARDWLREIRFNPATIAPQAKPSTSTEQLRTILGPRALRPLALPVPLILSGMGWGVAVSGDVRQALAEASALTGIALNSGEGPVWPAEPRIARPWIWQWPRAKWSAGASPAFVANMIELQIGQATEGGIRISKPRRLLPHAVRRRIPYPGPQTIRGGLPIPLAVWIRRARALGGGCPVAAKLPATDHVEADVEQLVRCGIDVITLDGAGAGTCGSPAVLSDHQSIPVALAVARAHDVLAASGMRPAVSVVASGHVHSAAEIAKLLALGADAVAVGTVALIALSHSQVSSVLPNRGPTSLVFAYPGNRSSVFDRDLAAEHLTNWIGATRQELQAICASVGVSDALDLGRGHLVADTQEAARALGVAWSGRRLQSGRVALSDLLAQLTDEWERGLLIWRRLAALLDSAGYGRQSHRLSDRGSRRRAAARRHPRRLQGATDSHANPH